MYYGKAIGRAKEYILGPAFLFPRFAGGRQMVCSSVHQQPRLAAAKTGGSSEGIKHPTTNWLRQSVPRPSKGGQWGAGSLGWGWKSFVRPLKGAARRLALQRLSGRLSPCGWGPCGAWWWDAWALVRASIPGLKALLEHHEVPRFQATAIFPVNLLPIYFDSIRIKIKRMAERLIRISQPFLNTWMEGRAREPLSGN